MRTRFLVGLTVFALLLPGCAPLSSEVVGVSGVEPYDDVRSMMWKEDLTAVVLNEALIETLWFNDAVRWSESDAPVSRMILEKGMNPGLGVRQLHAQGITGEGVNVAIIDQNLCTGLSHPEYASKIVKYYDVGTEQPAGQGSMHGPSVTSLLVGEQIGTAPGASLYYVAAPSWTGDAQYQADALNWIIAENTKLPEDAKIRVVSVSAAPSGEGSPFSNNNAAWDVAYEQAMEAGILVLDCTAHHGITAPCTYDLDDPDNVTKCEPGWPGQEYRVLPDRIHVPTSRRTTM